MITTFVTTTIIYIQVTKNLRVRFFGDSIPGIRGIFSWVTPTFAMHDFILHSFLQVSSGVYYYTNIFHFRVTVGSMNIYDKKNPPLPK